MFSHTTNMSVQTENTGEARFIRIYLEVIILGTRMKYLAQNFIDFIFRRKINRNILGTYGDCLRII